MEERSAERLDGLEVAILVEDGFEQVEMTEPRKALEAAGAKTHLISPREGKVKGWSFTRWGDEFPVDVPLGSASAGRYDALVLPGGLMSPDRLRIDVAALAFVKAFFSEGKPVASICHGPWTLINAEEVSGRTMTSYPSIRKDLENAGAKWVDEEVVVDRGVITSRSPEDLPAFNRRMIEEFSKEAQPVGERTPEGERL